MKSKIQDISIPDNISLPEFLFKRINDHGSRTAFTDVETGKEYRYSDLLPLVRQLGSALIKRNFRKGDVLCVISQNCIDFPVIMLATMSIGGVMTATNPAYTVGELEYQLKDSGSTYLVFGRQIAEKVMALSGEIKSKLKGTFVIGNLDGYTSVDDLYKDDGSSFSFARIDPRNDLALLPYSSATTGKAKGVMLTHYNFVAKLLQSNASAVILKSGAEYDTFVAYQPFFHVYGLYAMQLNGMYKGTRALVVPRFDLRTFLEAIQQYRATLLYLVPPIAILLAKSPLIDRYDLTSIRLIICGAAPLSKESQVELCERLGRDLIVLQGYGLTEAAGVTHSSPTDGNKNGSVGILFPNMEQKIIDIETGKELGVNQDGEICLRGPNVMKGYLKKPSDTAALIDEDGWLHTGDIGHFDEDEHLYIVDRLKELIKYKGFQVSPSELEGLLLEHPSVADAAVVGLPDLEAGELPRAYVVKKDRSYVTEQEIVKYVHDRVGPHKRLRGGVEFVNEIPKSPAGKILRRTLKERVAKAITAKSKL